MNELIKQTVMFIVSYILVLLIGFLLIQFLSNGFFSKFLKVKASRGKKILLQVKTMTDHYYTSGIVQEEFLVYKDRQKGERRIKVSDGDTYRSIGVDCLNINEMKGSIIRTTGEEVGGFDSVKFQDLYTRALMKPQLKDKKEQIKTVLAVLVLIGVLGFLSMKLIQIQEQVTLINAGIEGLKAVGVIQ